MGVQELIESALTRMDYWQIQYNKDVEFLDTKDLKPFISSEKNIYNIMNEIEDAFKGERKEIFEWMDSLEFKDYLEERYPDIKFYEVSEWRVQ